MLLLCLLFLAGCPSEDPTDDTSGSDAESDSVTDSESDEESFCTSEKICCDEDGSYVTSVDGCSGVCPSGSMSTGCSPEARCYDASNTKPTCVGAEGEIVEAECYEFETMSQWQCPAGTEESTSDAGMDSGM